MRLRTKLTFVTVIIVVLSIFLSTFFIVFFAKSEYGEYNTSHCQSKILLRFTTNCLNHRFILIQSKIVLLVAAFFVTSL